MLWSEVKRWAKQQGYEVLKETDGYYWASISSIECSGVSKSVSKLARDIFNNINQDQFIEHQKIFRDNQDIEKLARTLY